MGERWPGSLCAPLITVAGTVYVYIRCSLLTRVRMRRVSKHRRAECCRCRVAKAVRSFILVAGLGDPGDRDREALQPSILNAE